MKLLWHPVGNDVGTNMNVDISKVILFHDRNIHSEHSFCFVPLQIPVVPMKNKKKKNEKLSAHWLRFKISQTANEADWYEMVETHISKYILTNAEQDGKRKYKSTCTIISHFDVSLNWDRNENIASLTKFLTIHWGEEKENPNTKGDSL